MHEKLRPASVTKIMTILIITEYLNEGIISLTDSVPCSENASSMGGSQIWLDPNETLTVDEMLKSICVASANDCSVAMAEFIGGTEDGFVELMNKKASELGMLNTTFKNCHGLDEDGHLTTSYDIALMSKELLDIYPDITNYTTIWMESIRNGESELVNTNKLINTYNGITGLKTGSTGLALYNLSASATRDNLSLIAVVMKSPSSKIRFNEAQALLNYGFNTFSSASLASKGDFFSNIPINKGSLNTVEVLFDDNVNILVKKGQEKNIEEIVTISETITAPIEESQIVGNIKYILDGKTIDSVNLISKNSISKVNPLYLFKQISSSWYNLLR